MPIRRLTVTSRRSEEPKQDLPVEAANAATEIESVVRQARQTFGETLPKDYLSTDEYILYERLYGPPLRETRPEDLEFVPTDEEPDVSTKVRNVILKQNAAGDYEEIEFDPSLGFTVIDESIDVSEVAAEISETEGEQGLTNEAIEHSFIEADYLEEEGDGIQIQAQNQREIDAIARLQQDMEKAKAQPAEEEEEDYEEEQYIEEEEEIEEDEEEDYYDGLNSDSIRTHPHTMTGRGGTSPKTLSLPREQLIEPVTELLERTSTKHLMEAAEKAFGGKGLPFSASTPASKKLLGQKPIRLDVSQHRMPEIDADAYLAAVMPGTYAAIMSTLVEVRKRLGSEWIRDLIFREGGEGPRVLDAGGAGAGLVAWREIVQAEWDVMKEDGLVEGDEAPHGKSTVFVASNTLRHRVSRFLDNTTFIPRLPDYIHASNADTYIDGASTQPRKSYDIVIAPHTLFPLNEEFRRKNMVQNLWSLLNPNGGVLLLIEKGLPRGFEAIAGARSLLLDSHISSPGSTSFENELQSTAKERFTEKEDGMIIAPCTNHSKCPMYPVPGLSSGRKDFCHFGQRYIRPQYLQRVLGASIRNHEDVKYSYIAVRRGIDARKGAMPILSGDEATDQSFEGYEEYDLPEDGEAGGELSNIKFHALSLPRAILPPLKRRGHVTLDLCTPSGKLERWTVPRSFSKAAYRDARKSKWGDLWALGAKTRVARSPRLGRLSDDAKSKKKGIRDGRMGKGGKKMKKNKFDMIVGKDGMEEIREARSTSKFVKRDEKRTKRGRIYKPPKPITEDDL